MLKRSVLIQLILASAVILVVSAKDCAAPSDCASDECCVANIQPIGKRIPIAAGTCHALGHAGSGCYASHIHSPPIGLAYACPCGPGLVCKGSGTTVIPIGEAGTCVVH